MGRMLRAVLAVLAVAVAVHAGGQPFVPIASLNAPRAMCASAVASGQWCVFGGLATRDGGNFGKPLASIECWHVSGVGGGWRTLAVTLDQPMFAVAAVTLRNGSVLLMGGRNSSESFAWQSDATWLFDPLAETLIRGAHLPYATSSAVAVLSTASDMVYLTFGWRSMDFCRRTVAMLSVGAPAATWTVSSVSRYSHCDHGAAMGANGRVVMFAGAADEAPALNTMNEYSTERNTFRLFYKLTDARDLVLHASAVPGTALALGGRSPEMRVWASVEKLNVTHGWTRLEWALPQPLAAGTAHMVNATTLCIAGGFSTDLVALGNAWCRAMDLSV